MSGPAAILAADVGNSKTDVALITADGSVLGTARGASSSHQVVGLDRGIRILIDLAASAAKKAGVPAHAPFAPLDALCMAGVDTPRDERRLTKALRAAGFTGELILRNDMFAILRAGVTEGWGVAVVAGAGINGVGIGPAGRVVRFTGLGDISGDWNGVGWNALAAAVRGRDGRGPRTVLEHLVPEHFGLRRPDDVTLAFYRRRLSDSRLRELPPLVFAAAAAGDGVAGDIVDQLADEIAAFAIAAIRRTATVRREVEVVLGGGLARSGDTRLLSRVEILIHAVAHRARIVVLDRPPLLGAALLGLDRLAAPASASPAVAARLRAELTDARLAGS